MAHTCPIDGTLINEPTVRVVASLIAINTALGIYFQSPFIFLFLAFDFFTRGMNNKQWSLFRYISIKIVTVLNIKEKFIDSGGKIFAAKIGFIISTVLLLASILNGLTVIFYLGVVLVLFSTLESVLAYCVGCKIYTFYIKIK